MAPKQTALQQNLWKATKAGPQGLWKATKAGPQGLWKAQKAGPQGLRKEPKVSPPDLASREGRYAASFRSAAWHHSDAFLRQKVRLNAFRRRKVRDARHDDRRLR